MPYMWGPRVGVKVLKADLEKSRFYHNNADLMTENDSTSLLYLEKCILISFRAFVDPLRKGPVLLHYQPHFIRFKIIFTSEKKSYIMKLRLEIGL